MLLFLLLLLLLNQLDLIPDTIQKELASVKKVSNATQLIFNMETVSRFPENNYSKDPRLSIQTDNNPASFVDKT